MLQTTKFLSTSMHPRIGNSTPHLTCQVTVRTQMLDTAFPPDCVYHVWNKSEFSAYVCTIQDFSLCMQTFQNKKKIWNLKPSLFQAFWKRHIQPAVSHGPIIIACKEYVSSDFPISYRQHDGGNFQSQCQEWMQIQNAAGMSTWQVCYLAFLQQEEWTCK